MPQAAGHQPAGVHFLARRPRPRRDCPGLSLKPGAKCRFDHAGGFGRVPVEDRSQMRALARGAGDTR